MSTWMNKFPFIDNGNKSTELCGRAEIVSHDNRTIIKRISFFIKIMDV